MKHKHMSLRTRSTASRKQRRTNERAPQSAEPTGQPFLSTRPSAIALWKRFPHLKPTADLLKLEPDGLKWLIEEAHSIDKFPDYAFVTEEGRRFGLFLEGHLQLLRIRSAGVGIWTNDIESVEKLAGFIMELGTEHPPIMFNDPEELALAWAQHHVIFNVEPTQAEWDEYLDVCLPATNDDEEGGEQGASV
jgi:hypothetical protein